ncbi:pectin lyase fold/virulence factor [Mycena rosella]|uniref:galacturonan 1,4-alpha-galacturonidase n=1 Tax=Mycena rosella TaxID=1033263 RepID=A0AAD7GQ21_MYCRO|nr:pectin lyase fold/virulence factor [Mycena rosella]
MGFSILSFLLAACFASSVAQSTPTCTLSPLGLGLDDTDQVLAAIARCGHGGHTVFRGGTYNITRKMTWDLVDSKVDLHGYLSFTPDIDYWLNTLNTYRVVFIQNQASWFVITGKDFEVDAHNTGGIQGNGQAWWEYFTTHAKADGDGRPIALTLFRARHGIIRNFAINEQPFWCNCIAESQSVIYDGMLCNASNANPAFAGTKCVNFGINTYRSDDISLLDWDITCGDDCLAIKGNSTKISARNVTCRGGNGIAFGSLGQYANLSDIVENVHLQDIQLLRLDPAVQPNMQNGVYFKSWDGSINGVPPTGGGGGTGFAKNITAMNVMLDRVNTPLHVYQTNGGHSLDLPSNLTFGGLHFINWSGTALGNKLVDIECSIAATCTGITFSGFNVSVPVGEAPQYICQNSEFRAMPQDNRDATDGQNNLKQMRFMMRRHTM